MGDADWLRNVFVGRRPGMRKMCFAAALAQKHTAQHSTAPAARGRKLHATAHPSAASTPALELLPSPLVGRGLLAFSRR